MEKPLPLQGLLIPACGSEGPVLGRALLSVGVSLGVLRGGPAVRGCREELHGA